MSLAEQHEWFRRVTSRRALLRGGAIGAGAALAGPALLAGTASASTARSTAKKATPAFHRKNSYPGGQYLAPFGKHIAYGADPKTQMAVAWQTAGAVTNPFIRVGHSPLDLGHKVSAEVRNLATPLSDITDQIDSLPGNVTYPIEQYYLHAAIDGLRPGQTYYYSVGHDGWDSGDVSGSFTTAPHGRCSFRFTAFGDQGWSYDSVASATQIRSQNPAFHLHAGDISYAENGGDGLITDAYDPRVWDSYFNQIDPTAGSIPWNAVVGNHEMEPWYSPDGYGGEFARFDFPGGPSQTYYSFTYGNVGVVALDGNDVSYEIPANLGYTGGAQTAWLKSTLASLRANPKIDFIVPYFHNCAYSTCVTHGCEGGVEQYWVPLFDQYEVDLVINGHNHIYERTDPLRGGATTAAATIGSTVDSSKGTTYIVAGGAGKSLYSFSAADSYEGSIDNVSPVSTYINESGGTTVTENVTWSRIRYTGYCLLVIDSLPGTAGGPTLRITGLDGFGAEVDQINLQRP